jgi:hypothetical protein
LNKQTTRNKAKDWLDEHAFRLGQGIFLLLVFFGTVYWLIPTAHEFVDAQKQYIKEHPRPPSPTDIGYQITFDGADVKKLFVYDNRGYAFIETFTNNGWHIAAKQTNYGSCFNFQTCDEIVLEKDN